MGKTRIHLSIADTILQKLDTIAEARDFTDRVALFEQLVREEWERRNGPTTIVRDAPLSPEAAAMLQEAERKIATRTTEGTSWTAAPRKRTPKRAGA